jgi:hypothetical protein
LKEIRVREIQEEVERDKKSSKETRRARGIQEEARETRV